MMLRRTLVLLFAAASIGLISPTGAIAGGGGWHGGGWGWRGPALGIEAGADLASGYYGYPYEYGGYGEYAEYGPWAHGNRGVYAGCHSARQAVWAETGWLFRRVQVCE
jgi:hypothetical protein